MKQEAKDILIESAIEVFAEHGYRDAKIADIVDRAGANIAAVNYHFGSKEQLFIAALRRAHKDADEVYSSKEGLTVDASPEDRIAAVARAILRRSFDGGKAGNFNRIMNKTIHMPTSPIEMIMTEVEQFELKDLSQALAEYLKVDCEQLISLAVVTFLSLATMITKCPAGLKLRVFDNELETECDKKIVERMIDAHVQVIFASLNAMPKKFPKS